MSIKSFYLLSFLITYSNCFISREQYNHIKQNAQYEVMYYEQYESIFTDPITGKLSKSKIGGLISERLNDPVQFEEEESKHSTLSFLEENSLPNQFDWRVSHPKCFTDVPDQGHCGCCWAFATTWQLRTRRCIKSNQQLSLPLSAQQVLSCSKNSLKCGGGTFKGGWKYLEEEGVVSEPCVPYTSSERVVPNCMNRCSNDIFSYLKVFGKKNSFKIIEKNTQAIKEEIYKNGPVMMGVDMYADASFYEGGIYTPVIGHDEKPEEHAVTCSGWGVHNGVEYWILSNSWGNKWGENGFFKVRIGDLKSNLEVRAGLPADY